MSEELIRRMIEFLETASPFVWQVVNKQVLVVTVQSIFGCVILIVVAVVCTILAKKEHAKYKEDKKIAHNDNCSMCALIAVITSIIAGCLVLDVMGYLLNPDYRAIKILLELIK